MKKLLLAILTLGFFSVNASAQAFSVQDTSVVHNTSNGALITMHNMLSTTQTTDLLYMWRIKAHNFPTEWLNNDFGFCDGTLCYPNGVLSSTDWNVDTLRANKSVDMKLLLKPDVVNGSYYMTVEMKDAANTFSEEVTYTINKNVTNVNNIGRIDEVSIYPNPAREALNVVFDDRAGVKNIAVYNLIGKIVSIYKVNGKSAKLDLSDVPAGIYFVRLLNAQGQIVSTRKFTRQ